MNRNALTKKLLVIGVDGYEPMLAKKFMDEGKLPVLKAFVDRGSAREDLVLLGAMPTVTPPLWTTLATGAYPNTHGITCFFGQHPDHLDQIVYNLDSRRCQAESLWNVFAEDGAKKTLVWHWPGSSWPPTSESPNLHVVEGTQPTLINLGIAVVDILKVIDASEKNTVLKFFPNDAAQATGAGCVIDNVEELLAANNPQEKNPTMKDMLYSGIKLKDNGITNILTEEHDAEVETIASLLADTTQTPIKPAEGWTNAPLDAKEFYLFVSGGLERRPGLILKNAQGHYDQVALYRSKKDAKPYALLNGKEPAYNVQDTVKTKNGETIACVRHYQVLSLATDGSALKMYINQAMDLSRDDYFHPKTIFTEVVDQFGYPPIAFRVNAVEEAVVREVLIPSWANYTQWQANILTHYMAENRYEVIFSHVHNVDAVGHQFWHFAKHQDQWGNSEVSYQNFMEEMYLQTDRYLARFLPFLDEGWTMIITSDHGLISTEHHGVLLGEMGGVNVNVMEELGYTVLKRDENGNRLKEIDFSQTKAVAIRGDYIYINLKGRNATGIVDPADKYALEADIISDLYNYRDPRTGKRVVSIALRNKDAALFGMSGPECGDIIYFSEEGYCKIHADSLSTQCGYADTSVSPIFVAAGPGIKVGHKTTRVIRQVDVAPTLAVLGGVRMPAQCEGAPVYQILTEVF